MTSFPSCLLPLCCGRNSRSKGRQQKRTSPGGQLLNEYQSMPSWMAVRGGPACLEIRPRCPYKDVLAAQFEAPTPGHGRCGAGCHFHSAAVHVRPESEPERDGGEPTRSDGNFPFFDAPRPPPQLNLLPLLFSTLCSPFLILLIPQSPPAWLFFLLPLLSLRRSLLLLVIPSPSLCSSTFTCPPPSPALVLSRPTTNGQTELPREISHVDTSLGAFVL